VGGCDPLTGACVGGCALGFTGENCQEGRYPLLVVKFAFLQARYVHVVKEKCVEQIAIAAMAFFVNRL